MRDGMMEQMRIMEHFLPEHESSVIKTLLYFDIFEHPLRYEELYWFAAHGQKKAAFDKTLNSLSASGYIYCSKGNYFLYNKVKNVSARNSEAPRLKKFFKIARFMASLIATFPFVRGVFLSGSLSKLRASKDSDIDFFIITAPGRLWITRSLLILFKKVFLFNSYKYFCLNYFIDTRSLQVHTRNRYVATELVTLIPVYNYGIYQRFIRSNQWIKDFFPNFPMKKHALIRNPFSLFLRKVLEAMLDNKVGDKIDDFLMEKMLKHRKKKFGYMDSETFDDSFFTQKNRSKHHQVDYRKIVMNKLVDRERKFEAIYKVKLQ
jgi:predicted nucleotidyltransferase